MVARRRNLALAGSRDPVAMVAGIPGSRPALPSRETGLRMREMRRMSILAMGCALAGCMAEPPPPPAPPRSEARRVQRPAYRPVLIPVRNHVSDSIAESFPAVDAPVADELIYGAPGPPGRILRSHLGPPGSPLAGGDAPAAPAAPPSPEQATSEDGAT